MDDLQRDDVVGKIDALVEELLARAGIDRPPVDAIALAQKSLGMVVCLDKRQPQRGRAQRAGGQKHIYLKPEPREERHQWTVAHEIGEHLKPDILTRLGFEPGEARPMMGESLANLFSYRLLVPTCWYKSDAVEMEYDLLALKEPYSTASHEVLAWRWLDLADSCIVTIVDNDTIHRRRSNAWPTRRELSGPEKKCQRYVNQKSRPHVVREAGWTVSGWPVHELGWKREVLRSQIEDDAFPGE